MSIAPIGSIASAAGLTPTAPTTATDATDATGASAASGNTFTDALDNVQSAQDNADNLALQAATGDLTDVHNYTIAATEAQLTTELTVAVRDRAVTAFNEVMGMQV